MTENDEMTGEVELHDTQVVVWDVPATIECGEKFSVKLGVKCSSECQTDGRGIQVTPSLRVDDVGPVATRSHGIGVPGLAVQDPALRLAHRRFPGFLFLRSAKVPLLARRRKSATATRRPCLTWARLPVG